MPVELILLAVDAGMLAVKYGRKVDLIKAGQTILSSDLGIPMADPDDIEEMTDEEIRALLTEYQTSGDDATLVQQARTLLDQKNLPVSESIAFLALVFPERLPSYAIVKQQLETRDGSLTGLSPQKVLLLRSIADLSGVPKQMILLATEFLATIGDSFAPHVIGNEGVKQLVQGVLERFINSSDIDAEGKLSKILAERAFNASMDALATNSGGLQGKSELLELGFELVSTFKKGMKSDEEWKTYAGSFFQDGGFLRLVGTLTTIGAGRIVATSGDQAVKDVVRDLALGISTQLSAVKGDSKAFLKDNWHELLGGAVSTLTSHSGALLAKEPEWIKLSVSASGLALTELVEAGVAPGGDFARSLVSKLSAAYVAHPELLDSAISEAGLKTLIVSVLTPLSTTEGLSAPGLKADLATRLVSGLVGLAANDTQLKDNLFSPGEAVWVGRFATEFSKLADNDALAGLFTEEGRKVLGIDLVDASLQSLAAGKADLIDSASEIWLRAIIGSVSEAAGSLSFRTLVGKDGVRAFVTSAVAVARKNPELLNSSGNGPGPLLPTLLETVQNGLAGGTLSQTAIASVMVESLGSWVGSNKELHGMDLAPLFTSLSKAFANGVRSGRMTDPALLRNVAEAVTKSLASRIDVNHLIRPETIGLALEWLFQRGLSTSDLMYAVSRVSARILNDVPASIVEELPAYNEADWKRTLTEALANTFVNLPVEKSTNVRTALLLDQIDAAMTMISTKIVLSSANRP